MRYPADHAFHTLPSRLGDAVATERPAPAPGASAHDRRVCRPPRVVAASPGVLPTAAD